MCPTLMPLSCMSLFHLFSRRLSHLTQRRFCLFVIANLINMGKRHNEKHKNSTRLPDGYLVRVYFESMAARVLPRVTRPTNFYINRPRVHFTYYRHASQPGAPQCLWLQKQAAEGRRPYVSTPRERRRRNSGSERRNVEAPEPRVLRSPKDGDEYRWMQDINSDEVVQHLENENRFADFVLRPLYRRATELHERMMDRQPEAEGGDRRSVPERLGPYLYYTRRDDGKDFPLYVRRPAEGGTLRDEQVILDLSDVELHGLMGADAGDDIVESSLHKNSGEGQQQRIPPRMGSMKLSSDQRLVACTMDIEGTDRFTLAIFYVGDGEVLEERAPLVPVLRDDSRMLSDVVGIEWGRCAPAPDGGGYYELYYTVPDELRRPWQVRRVLLRSTASMTRSPVNGGKSGSNDSVRHRGSKDDDSIPGLQWAVDMASDAAVFEEVDDAFFVDVGKTKDHAFVVINVHSKTTSEILLLPAITNTADTPSTTTPSALEEGVLKTASSVAGKAHVSKDEGSKVDHGVLSSSRGSSSSDCSPVLLRKRKQGVEFYVDHAVHTFYLITNSPPERERGICCNENVDTIGGAEEYRLVRLRQPRGKDGPCLRGIADEPWESVRYYGRESLENRDTATKTISPLHTHQECSDVCSLEDNEDKRRKDSGGATGVGELVRDTPDGVEKHGDIERQAGGHEGAAAPVTAIRGDVNVGGGEGAGGTIEEMDLFREHCVLYETSTSGSPRLRVVPLGSPESAFVVTPPPPGGCGGGDCDSKGNSNFGGEVKDTAMADGASVLRPGVNAWLDSKTARFSVSSPTAPEDVYDLCLQSGRLDLLRRTNVPGSPRFDSSNYRCYRVQVSSHDGVRIPLTIAHDRSIVLDGTNRLVLHGYGAYGMHMPIDYHPGHACMLERGWVLAFAHVRGGGERGKRWHADGRGQNKWNSFRDFEACARYLVTSGFTTSARMGLHVSSAGGLLAGVMANTQSDLFAAMVLKAPFLGVMSAMSDASLPLTVHEYDEWGNPNDSEDAEAMIRSWCPYENVRTQAYPAMMVSASLNDTRVNYWDPAKWVSRVRARNTGTKAVVLRVSDSDGHDGPDSTFEGLQDAALEMAFLEKHLGGGAPENH